TDAPSLIREKDVRFHVSSARSQRKEFDVSSTAVRQTPLTAMLLPCLSSFTNCEDDTVMRRVPCSSTRRLTLPTSSMMPVNIGPSWMKDHDKWCAPGEM